MKKNDKKHNTILCNAMQYNAMEYKTLNGFRIVDFESQF